MISGYTIMGALVTPFIVFISTANHLFLKNQVELYHDLRLYIPYLIAFLIVWMIGVGLHLVRTKTTTLLLWLFFFSGPWVMISANIPSTVSMVLLLVLIVSAILLRKRPVKGAVSHFFSILAILFVIIESYTFFSQYQPGGNVYQTSGRCHKGRQNQEYSN